MAKKKCVLERNGAPIEVFDQRFRELFDITFTNWKKKATLTEKDGVSVWTDGKIEVGAPLFDEDDVRVFV